MLWAPEVSFCTVFLLSIAVRIELDIAVLSLCWNFHNSMMVVLLSGVYCCAYVVAAAYYALLSSVTLHSVAAVCYYIKVWTSFDQQVCINKAYFNYLFILCPDIVTFQN